MRRYNSITKLFALAGLSFLLLSAAGCKKSSNDNSTQITDRGRGETNVVGATTQNINGQNISAMAYVNGTSNFQAVVSDLVSAQIDPSFVGNVSPTSGMIIRGAIQIDGSGNIVTSGSRLALEIRDEYAGQTSSSGEAIPAITMTLPGAKGFAYNGRFQLIFRDPIGELLVQGSFSNGPNGTLNGQLYFANFKRFDGSTVSNPQYILLGSFSIQTCGFFICQ